jgi:hypothetical protein
LTKKLLSCILQSMDDRYLARSREGARLTRALDAYANALDAQRPQFSGPALEDAFFAVEHALFLHHGVSEDKKDELRHGLAGRGAQVAAARRSPGTVASMREFQERIVDSRAIRHGVYPLVEVRRDHGEQHGAPDSTTPIYLRPDGVKVWGQSSSVREGRGVYGGIRDLAPGEISDHLSPIRKLPPRRET